MQRSLGYLTIFSAGVFGLAAVLWATGMVPTGRINLKGTGLAIDPLSFSAGTLFGLTCIWFSMVPWHVIPRVAMSLLRSWRRNFVLAALAVTCTGVLLFY